MRRCGCRAAPVSSAPSRGHRDEARAPSRRESLPTPALQAGAPRRPAQGRTGEGVPGDQPHAARADRRVVRACLRRDRFPSVDLTVLKGGETRIAHAHVQPRTDATRADIVDRNGVLLARTLESQALVAYPKQVDNAAEAARKLVAALPDLNQHEVQEKLASGRKYVRLRRQLTPDQQFAVNNLGIPGVKFETTGFRVYPKGELTSAVVGYVDAVDNKGLAGI